MIGKITMSNQIKYNLLLKNPILDSYKNMPLPSEFIVNSLGIEIALPTKLSNSPFLFSCFALSLDGKLCYPDTLNGFDIASANHHATNNERYADWLYLMFARSISDAIILGSNGFKKNATHHTLEMPIAELAAARAKNSQPQNPWSIIFCRDLATLDLEHEVFTNDNFPCLICTSEQGFTSSIPKYWNQQKLSLLTKHSDLKTKNIAFIDIDLPSIFKNFKNLGFNVILNESPFWHHKFLQNKLLNEIWLNYACSYIGGSIISLGNTQQSFESKNHPDTEILTLHHLDYHFLYSRQLVKYAL